MERTDIEILILAEARKITPEKKCKECGEIKPISEFYFNFRKPPRKSRFFSECKKCGCKRANKSACSERWRRKTGFYKRPDVISRTYIRDIGREAVRKGIIVKTPCLVCGEKDVQAHHKDYNKPTDIMWLCDLHHREWHKHNKSIPEKTLWKAQPV